MTTRHGDLSLGVAGALGAARIADIAVRAEAAGFARLWVNDTPGGDALAGLAAAAERTSSIGLATGVVPIDRVPARGLAERATQIAGASGRLMVGIGSGRLREGALAQVAAAIGELREAGVPVLVGAPGPRMRRLAVTASDGVLLNWLTPRAAADQTAALHEIAPDARVALYVRWALEPAARARLDDEASRYDQAPGYAENFARLGFRAHDTVLAPDSADAPGRVRAYREALDEVVLRAITPTDAPHEFAALIDRAGRWLADA